MTHPHPFLESVIEWTAGGLALALLFEIRGALIQIRDHLAGMEGLVRRRSLTIAEERVSWSAE